MLATNGLRVEEHIIDGHINTEKTIPLATRNILKHWHRSQLNSKAAYSKLCNILEGVGMNMFVRTVLNG